MHRGEGGGVTNDVRYKHLPVSSVFNNKISSHLFIKEVEFGGKVYVIVNDDITLALFLIVLYLSCFCCTFIPLVC